MGHRHHISRGRLLRRVPLVSQATRSDVLMAYVDFLLPTSHPLLGVIALAVLVR